MKKRIISLLMALALSLTLLPTGALADNSKTTVFQDISGHWAEKTINEWREKGYISGYSDGTFRPDSSITRASFIKLLNRVLGLTAEEAISFTDVKESDWFYSEVAKAVAAGYAQGGADGTFQPSAPITRAEAAAMIARALGLTANESRAAQFADAAAIPAWAKGSVGAVAEAGYMTGYPGGSFGAEDSITRAQAVVTLDRVQNVTITEDGTVLSDQTVAGDLIIAEAVGEGEVTLKNVTVQGDLIIRGGASSIYLNGVTVEGEVRLEKENLHLRLLGGTKLGTVRVLAKVKLSGSGTIELLLVSADGVTMDRNLTVRKTETADGVKAPTVYNRSSGSSSGGGSSGGTVTPPAQQDKTVTGAAPITGVTVDYNTSEQAALAALPSKVTLNCSDGSTVTAAVTGWTVSGYEAAPRTTTDCTAAAEVTVPNGYTNSGDTLTAEATLTVRGGDKTIQSIVVPAGFEVNYNTSETDAMKRLPSEVKLETYSGGTMVFAAVKWVIKDGQTYKPDTAATITYVGTVTIPNGYQWDGETTIEAAIVVLPDGQTAKDKLVGSSAYAADVYVDRYTAIMSEIREFLPEQIRLQCVDDSWITVTVDKAKWENDGKMDDSGNMKYSFNCRYQDITLPAGYEFTSVTNIVNVGINVKNRDIEALQTALNAAWEQLDRMADTEEAALYFTEKVYIAPDNTAASAIATGAKFLCQSEIAQKRQALSDLILGGNDAGELCNILNLLNQDAIDAKAGEISAASEEVKAILDTAKTGTGYTQANILANIKKWLDENESNSNYAYSKSMQPLTVEKHGTNGIPLPQIATGIQINAAGTTADISLTWSIADDTYAELKTENDQQYVWLNGNNDEPKNLSLTVNAISYKASDGKTVYLNETNHNAGVQVEAYNNLIVGAPIARYPNTSGSAYVDVDELISGKEQTFGIRIPLQYNSPKIEAIDVKQAAAQCSDGLLTGKIAVDSVLSDASDQRGPYTVLQAQLTATTKQLDAVVDADKLEPAKVTLLLPYGAVTLTEWAIEQGWYVPQDGLKLEAEVKIHHPLVEITKAAPDGEAEVRVNFSTQYWGDSYRAVWMALVPENVTDFTGSETGCFKSEYGLGCSVDAYYDITIPVSGIQAGEKYYVWVRVGDDGKWMKSNTTYTQATGN